MDYRLLICTLAAGALSNIAIAGTAKFDSIPEGIIGASFAEAGITFHDFDRRLPGDPNLFVCEWAEDTLSGPYFSAPNTLAFGGWSPGAAAAFSRCGEFWMTPDSVSNSISLELFEASPAGNTVTLELYLDTNVVDITMIVMPGGFNNHHTFSLQGTAFDSARLVGQGAQAEGCYFGLVDNVVIEGAAPCPPDVNADGFVDVLDLLAVLAAWGAAGGPEDINGDGAVNVLDLLEVLAAWGPCQ